MTLAIYRPQNVFDNFNREFERLFAGNSGTPDAVHGSAQSDWAPAVNIHESEAAYSVEVEVPGIDPKEIDVTFDSGVLTISGERSLENVEDKEGYKRVERRYGSFRRSFTLPDHVDADAIKAKGSNGVLTVNIPKRESVLPKKIAIN